MSAPAPDVLVVSTGVANVASMMAGLRRTGGEPRLARDADEVLEAGHVVLPGVGAFGAGIERLRAEGMTEVLRRRVREGKPTLAVCLGLQLLCESSEEDPDLPGLGVVPGRVRRFEVGLRVPHFGWNRVEPDGDCRRLKPGYAYFANSYRLADRPDGWAVATTDYGGPFVAALERGAVMACQFHPELSGEWGLALLRGWLAAEGGRSRC